jgi:hypothetical protein
MQLLQCVQESNLFDDCKTFVDLVYASPPAEVNASFQRLLQESAGLPSLETLRQFVSQNFLEAGRFRSFLRLCCFCETKPNTTCVHNWALDTAVTYRITYQLTGLRSLLDFFQTCKIRGI